MNVKKFVQSKNKNLKQAVQSKNKENNKIQDNDLVNKKVSIGLHGFSQQISFSSHKKSINQQISVFLELSQNKTFGFDRNCIERDIKVITENIKKSSEELPDVLRAHLQSGQVRTQQLAKFIQLLLNKLDKMNHRTSESEFDMLGNNILRPYLEQQITLLQKNFEVLRKKNHQLLELKNIKIDQKQIIKNSLLSLIKQQQKQIQELSKQ